MQHHGKKLCALLLALCMIVGFIPMTASAALLEGEDYITQQLYLGEDLVLHLRGDIPEAYQSATATITFCGESKSCSISDLTQDENGLYDMAVEVDVAEMTESIGLKATYMGLTAIEENYSVAGYLKALISGNYTNQTKLLALELLNFGAAAQNYFDYNTDALANAGGYEYAPANAVPSEIPTVGLSGSVDGVRFYGASVRFLSKTAVRFYFEADSVDGLTFTVDGTEYTPASNENGYYIEVGGINPQDMDNVMTVEVTNGTDTLSVEYAPIYYFIRTYHNNENEEMKTLAAAAYSYFVAANNFVGVEPTGDFMEGVYFDDPGNVQLFSGVGGDRDALLEIVSVEGNNVLKLTCASSQWPVFRINFGTTFKAGTTIDFRAYTTDISNADKSGSKSLFEGMPGESYLVYSQGSDATAEYAYNTWTDLSIVLAEDRDYVDLVCNMDRSNDAITCTNIEVYMDDFKAYEPVEISGDILEGLDFEDAGNALWFTGTGNGADATIRRVAYADLGIEALADGGSYALKVSHTTQSYPTFRINFGKILKAGTSFTFDAYASTDGSAIVLMKSDWTQASYLPANAWRTDTAWEITLAEDCDHIDMMWEMRGNSTVPSYIIIDNIKATEPSVEPCGDFLAGVDFETEGNELRFEGTENDTDATIERVAYADLGIEALADGGSYALKVSHTTQSYPTFRINFGKTLKAGTSFTFDAYASTDGSAIVLMNSDWTQASYLPANAWRTDTAWEITLAEDCDHIDMMWEMRGNSTVPSYIIIDNIKATEPSVEPCGDFLAGVDFETEGNELRFEGTENDTDATIERVAYADLGIEALADGGSYALKVSHTTQSYPTFRINFGKILKAGTSFTFDAYASTDGSAIVLMKSDWTQASYLPANAWRTDTAWEITLAEDCDHIDMMWEMRGNSTVPSYIIIDNIVAVEPEMAFQEGVTFEEESDKAFFTGQDAWNDATIERVSYEAAGITAAPNGGSYALKLTHASSQWPAFRINLSRTMPAGTVIVYDAYSACTSMSDANSAKSLVVWKNAAGNEVEMHSLYGQWTTLRMTLDTDTDVVNLYWNMDQWDIDYACTDYALYLDNIIAVEPINQTVSFEYAADAGYFTGIGRDWSEATVERVAYADLGIGAPADGGEYAVKLSHNNDQYPTFRINFGKTVKAGTKLKMDIYGSYDYAGENQSGCVVLCFNDPWAQAVYLGINTWYEDCTLEAELSADCTYVDFYWETRLGVDAPSYIVVDNIEIIEAA